MAKPVTIPEPVLNRAQRRKLLEKGARRVVSGSASAYTVIEDYVVRVYFGKGGKLMQASWYHNESDKMRKVEKTLHYEIGLHLSLAVAKLLRDKLGDAERRVNV